MVILYFDIREQIYHFQKYFTTLLFGTQSTDGEKTMQCAINEEKQKFTLSIKEGNINSFEVFYRTEYNNLCYFVSSFILHKSQMVEDIVQESFLSFWASREVLDPSQSIRAYLYTIARNKAINVLKIRSRYTNVAIEQKEIRFSIEVLESEELTSKIDALDMERIIDKTYNILKGPLREAFILSRKYGKNYREIARKMGVSEKSVERYISTALKIFRTKLSHFLPMLITFF